MPGVETGDLTDSCVVWEPGPADVYGQYPAGPPCELGCRWEVTESEDGTEGNQATSVTVSLDRLLPIGSFVQHGSLEDAPAPSGDLRVVSCTAIPDVKGRQVRYSVRLGQRPSPDAQ
jgi:hypothetical protein